MPDAPPPDELYVGYLPVPPRQRSFLRWAVPAVLWLLCATSFFWSHSQHSPGPAVWNVSQPLTLRGVLTAKPYPILFTQSADGVGQAILLVEAGKRGSRQRASALDGRQVVVSGWSLHRDGRRLLELEPAMAAMVADTDTKSETLLPAMKPVGPVTLRGEIVDSKCFLGAMKPGEGKAHKQCATLCVRGGIPPMLVTHDANAVATYYLLQDPSGGPIDPAIFPLIADAVEVRGDLATWGGLNILSVRPESFRRL